MGKRKEPKSPPDRPETKHPSAKRAKEIDAHTPYEELQQKLESQPSGRGVKQVLHWFRSKDLRIHDNHALHGASEMAKESSIPLICMYLHCPPELKWHDTFPAPTDFILETLKLLQKDLKALTFLL